MAVALLTYIPGLRKASASAITWASGPHGDGTPDVSDISFSRHNGLSQLQLRVTHQKNHELSEPMLLVIPEQSWGLPGAHAFTLWHGYRVTYVGSPKALHWRPCFPPSTHLPVRFRCTPYQSWPSMMKRLVAPLRQAGYQRSYTPHCFRRGLFTSAFHGGAAADFVQEYGNWSSDACRLYYHLSTVQVQNTFTEMCRFAFSTSAWK